MQRRSIEIVNITEDSIEDTIADFVSILLEEQEDLAYKAADMTSEECTMDAALQKLFVDTWLSTYREHSEEHTDDI